MQKFSRLRGIEKKIEKNVGVQPPDEPEKNVSKPTVF